jgi:hypothetical protein
VTSAGHKCNLFYCLHDSSHSALGTFRFAQINLLMIGELLKVIFCISRKDHLFWQWKGEFPFSLQDWWGTILVSHDAAFLAFLC